MNKLQRIKEQAVRAILPRSDHVQAAYRATVCAFPFSYSVGRTIINFCQRAGIMPQCSRVLIVGAAGGRDFNWLTGFGYAVDLLDLGDHSWCQSTYLGDVCRPETWTQINSRYDVIVMCDILEHLPEDFAALKLARTVLKDEGYLFLSVPYRHDPEPTHVRSYSEATIKRLLGYAGYKAVWKRDRPGLLEAYPVLVNSINYGLALLMPSAQMGARCLHFLLRTEFAVNEKTRTFFRLFGRSPQKGVSLALQAVALDAEQDYVSINREMFVK